MPLIESLHRPIKTLDVSHAWLEDIHQQAVHPAATWTDFSHLPVDASYILVTSSPDRDLSRMFAEQVFGTHEAGGRRDTIASTEDLRHRLNNANNHFRRKAAEVLGDEDAVVLLADLYEQSSIGLSDFDTCQHGIALARLTAANFCEVGANVIYITEAGQSFIESLDQK